MTDLLIEPFNPYAARYPNRRVITRNELHLYKILRAGGIDARVAGDPAHELNYLAIKGFSEWLNDPVVLLLVNIPLSVICGVLANMLHDLFSGRQAHMTDVLIELDQAGTRARYTCDGNKLEDGQFNALIGAMQARRQNRSHATALKSPYANRPIPLFLEHTDRVVGWGNIRVDDKGLRLENAIVTDQETWARIENGTLRGLSIGALVRQARCGICGQSYFDCQHVTSRSYDGAKCVVHLTELDLGEISIVKDPVNPLAQIHWCGDKEG